MPFRSFPLDQYMEKPVCLMERVPGENVDVSIRKTYEGMVNNAGKGECRRMKKRSRLFCVFLMMVLLCTACGKESGQEIPKEADATKENDTVVTIEEDALTTNKELFDFVTETGKIILQIPYMSIRERRYRL